VLICAPLEPITNRCKAGMFTVAVANLENASQAER